MNTVDYEKNLDRIGDWIRSVDKKVSIFLAFQGLVLSGILPLVFKVIEDCYIFIPGFLIFILISGIIFLFYGTIKSILAIIPNLKNHHKKSLLYFKNVASLSLSEYKKQIKSVDSEKYGDILLDQIHVLSLIATKKHEQFRDAILMFFSGLIFLFVWILFLLFLNYVRI